MDRLMKLIAPMLTLHILKQINTLVVATIEHSSWRTDMMIIVASLLLILLPGGETKVFTFSFAGTGNATALGGAAAKKPRDCSDILAADGSSRDGVYTITPSVGSGSIDVYCDMTNNGGGWTVIQRRTDGSEDFFRTWADYKEGFGALVNEFWLGNDNINRITNQRINSIRIDVENFSHSKRYAVYKDFYIGNEEEKYKLHFGDYSGDAGDAFSVLNGISFTTKDRDNDKSDGSNCAQQYLGGWWYTACHSVNLNGQYNNTAYGKGINWRPFTTYNESLKQTTMKIRPF